MVARIRTGKSVKCAINYNEMKVRKGHATLIHVMHYPKDAGGMNFHEKLNRLQKLADLNTRVETNCLHVSLNFDPSESLSREKLNQIAAAYMEGIGFRNRPYLVYQHTDAAHPHIHIVTTNIQKDGTRISMHNLGRVQSEKTRKEIEGKFGLVKADGRQQKLTHPLRPINIEKATYGKDETKRAISNLVTQVIAQYKFASLPEFNAVLRQYNVIADRGAEASKMFQKGGLQYSLLGKDGEKIGIPIKASSIYESPTIKNLETKFQIKKNLKEAHRKIVLDMIRVVIDKKLTRSKFIQELQYRRIDVVLRRNKDNFVYGITYVDHVSKSVFNGSDLGKEFSAAGLRQGWEYAALKEGDLRTMKANTQSVLDQPLGFNSSNTLLDELTTSTAGFNPQLPYPLRKRKRKNYK